MKKRFLSVSIFLLLTVGSVFAADLNKAKQTDYQVGDRLKQNSAQPKVKTPYKDMQWDALVPKGWDPSKLFQNENFDMMSDADPKAMALLKKIREVWDNAPVNEELNGAKIRIPGFLVPLEGSKKTFTEFLLVPYFGACIHTPPPPANQIIHVTAVKPLKSAGIMDAVWVSGTLKTSHTKNDMGDAGYKMAGEVIVPYQGK